MQHFLLRKQVKYSQHQNIFMTQHEQDESQLYRDGKLVPYYIVGKPEIIENKNNISQPILEDKIIKTKPKTIHQRRRELSLQQQQQNSKDEDIDFIQIDMNISSVENEIEKIQQRKLQNNNVPNKKLNIPDQKVVMKEERIQQAFEKQKRLWNRDTLKSAQICKRPASNSIYNQIDADRQKGEDKKLLDIIQTDAERYGNKLWERQLRSSSDAVENHNKIIAQGNEIIRKSNQYSIYLRPKSFAMRFSERQEQVNEVQTIQNVNHFQIEGENVLKKETECLFNMIKEQKKQQMEVNSKSTAQMQQIPQRKTVTPFRKIIPAKAEILNKSPEIIKINYDKQILRQQGKLDIYKHFF